MVQLHHRARSLWRVANSHGPSEALQLAVVNPVVGLWVERVADDVVTHDGLAFHLDAESVSVFTKGAIARRRHEREERSLVERHLPRETDVVELGGGVGYLTAFVADRVAGEVVVVEANPDLIPVLERNRFANDLEYSVVNAAYTPTNDPIPFPVSSNYKFSSVYKPSERTTVVPGTSLANLVRTYDVDGCALIVDVEGAEVDLVREEGRVLNEVCDWLLIEFHPKITGREEAETAKRRLRTAGFDRVDTRRGVVLYRNRDRE